MKLKTENLKLKTSKIWLVVFGLLAAVIGIQLMMSNILAVRGNELSGLEKQAAALSRNNQTIKQEMSRHSSLTNIASMAESLGMVKPESLLYIDITAPIAAVPTVQ